MCMAFVVAIVLFMSSFYGILFQLICIDYLPLQHQIQIAQMKELEEQLTTVQHDVKQWQLHCQELEEQLKGSHELNTKLQQEVDEYCSSVDKLEEELAVTRQKHQIAIQEVCVCVCVLYLESLLKYPKIVVYSTFDV